MTIWYDVSGLVDWRRPHLGGIERTAAGILDGLHRLGIPVRLVHFRPGMEEFETVAEENLPAAVREMCPWLRTPAAAALATATPVAPHEDAAGTGPEAAAEPPASRRLRREVIYGPGPEGKAFRAAWVAFRVAGRELVRHAGRRIGLRRPPRDAAAIPAGAAPLPEPVAPVPPPASHPRIAFQRGDVLLSLGGTFAIPGHPAAVAAARDRGAAVVRMVYDMVPVTKPQWLAPRSVEVAWLRDVVERSDAVLVISECTRRELLDYCLEAGLAPPRTAVVRLGDVLHGSAAADVPAPRPRFVPSRPFFLCVSSLNVRKNHRGLYDAWSVLVAGRGDRCPDLLCVGTPHAHVDDLVHEIRHDRAVNRHLHLLDGVRDAELDWYYRHCVATIYPSKHEGWGLPVAESLGYGRLCLASSASSMPEISDLPEFFPPHDTPRLATLVARCVDDPEWLAGREERIRREFRRTTWTDTAAAVVQAIGGMPAAASAA